MTATKYVAIIGSAMALLLTGVLIEILHTSPTGRAVLFFCGVTILGLSLFGALLLTTGGLP